MSLFIKLNVHLSTKLYFVQSNADVIHSRRYQSLADSPKSQFKSQQVFAVRLQKNHNIKDQSNPTSVFPFQFNRCETIQQGKVNILVSVKYLRVNKYGDTGLFLGVP